MKRQKYLTLMIVLLILILAAGCQSNLVTEDEEASIDIKDADIGHYIVQMEMEDGGIMVFELYPEFAPETVENFVELVESGFYDGLNKIKNAISFYNL